MLVGVSGHTVIAGSMAGVQHNDLGGGTWNPTLALLPDHIANDSFVTVTGQAGAAAGTSLDPSFGAGTGSVIPIGAGWLTSNPGSPIPFTGGRIKIMQVAGNYPNTEGGGFYTGRLTIGYRASAGSTTPLYAENLDYTIGISIPCPGPMVSASPQLLPYSFANPQEWTATNITPNSQGATLTVRARGQLGGSTRFLIVRIDGVILATNVFGAGSGAGGCTTNVSTVTLPIAPAQFAQLTADGQLEVRIEPSINATSAGCANAELQVLLSYVRDIFDCDGSGTDDECQLQVPETYDCDENGQLDSCEVSLPDVDCDGNLIPDICDILAGAEDKNGNGRLDSCELRFGDLNLDGKINGSDLAGLLAVWGLTNPPYGDLNGDDQVDGSDLAFLLARWGPVP